MHIQTIAAADLPKILEIQRQCYGPAFLESAESFSAKIELSGQTCWLARREHEALGYLITLPVSLKTFPALNASSFTHSDSPELLYLHDLAITPAGRSLGLGRLLIEHAITVATASGLAAAGLIAVQDSLAYWARYGFAEIDVMARDPAGDLSKKIASFGADARYMEKALSPSAG